MDQANADQVITLLQVIERRVSDAAEAQSRARSWQDQATWATEAITAKLNILGELLGRPIIEHEARAMLEGYRMGQQEAKP